MSYIGRLPRSTKIILKAIRHKKDIVCVEEQNHLSFENWLMTAHGQRCLDFRRLTPEYLKNRLWWAFHAGNMSRHVWMTSEVQRVLEEVAMLKGKPSTGLQSRVQYILDNKEDFSLQALNSPHDTGK